MIAQALAIYKQLNPANLSTSSAESSRSETSVNNQTYTGRVIDDVETSINKATDAVPSDSSGKIFSLQSPPRDWFSLLALESTQPFLQVKEAWPCSSDVVVLASVYFLDEV